MQFPIKEKFILSENFIEKYKNIKPNFGFGGLGEFVYMRTYSRLKADGKNEMWWETVRRVVEGIYSIQKQHIEDYSLGWNQSKAQKSAQEMYDRIFNFKMLGSGRALWAMGSPVIMEKGLTAALYNCSFISTENISENPGLPFKNAMDFLMLGVGVGSDTRGAGKIVVKEQKEKEHVYTIPDTREGWIESVQLLINSFFGSPKYEFDYSQIRPAGMPIKTFGGVSAGSKPLEELHDGIVKALSKNIGKEITARTITDMMNMIGKAVVSGNVRRSAEIILGDASDEFLELKDYSKNPDRTEYGWASNNSVLSNVGDNYKKIALKISQMGEPGVVWIQNMRKYGRMRETEANWKDRRLSGVNPCVTGETEILTRGGYEQIQNLVNIPIEIWNGFEWSSVVPKITGKNQDVLTISFNDGRSLTCTPYHKFHIMNGYTKSHVVEAKDLKLGDKLIKHNFPILDSEKNLENAYTNGFVSAEGMELSRTLYVYYPKEKCLPRIEGIKFITKEINNKRHRIVLNFVPKSKSFVPLEYSVESKLKWLSGLFDGDGTELKEGGLQLASTNLEFLSNVQKLLTTLGIQSKIVPASEEKFKSMPNHKGGYELYPCKKTERICIGSVQMQELIRLGLRCERMNFNKNPQRDASQFVMVTDITHSGIAETVYCFNEKKNHTAIFNGILTGQCSEIGLESSELCNLVETFPTKHKDLDDYKQTLKYAYLFAKTVTLLNTNWSETNKVMLRNRRIGLSMTGITMFISQNGMAELKKWMEQGYETIQKYDEVYSEWFAVPTSIKFTTAKPSGTLSLLAGVTPGIHFPESQNYIRRVRLAKNSPFVEVLKNSSYKIEPAKEDVNGTVVVEFPVSLGNKIKTINDVSMWEQLNLAAFVQENWSDNAVSVTITFKENEAKDIETALDIFQFKLKSVSFLPKIESGTVYDQMPYEEINYEKYLEISKQILPLDFSSMFSIESVGEQYCNNDSCSF